MKHQYFGDISDYRKYGLLRCIGEVIGKPMGVLWLITPDDGRSDGEFRSYLQAPQRWRKHDCELYDALSALLHPEQIRHTGHVEKWNLLPSASFFEHQISDAAANRRSTIAKAEHDLADCPVIFVDPDNGIEVKSVPYGSKGSNKYIYWRELESLYGRGHSLIVYQHYPRVPRQEYHAKLAAHFHSHLPRSNVTIFSTAHVAFVAAFQPEHAGKERDITALVADRWAGQTVVAWSD
jgi:hypothetical protein